MEDTPQAPTQNDNTLPQTMSPAPESVPERKRSLLGPILIVGIALIALALGGWYILDTALTVEPPMDESAIGAPAAPDTTDPSAETPSAPDDFSDIEAELGHDFSATEEELGGIDAALETGV